MTSCKLKIRGFKQDINFEVIFRQTRKSYLQAFYHTIYKATGRYDVLETLH